MFTGREIINLLEGYDNTIIEEIVIHDDEIVLITESSYICFDEDYIKTLEG